MRIFTFAAALIMSFSTLASTIDFAGSEQVIRKVALAPTEGALYVFTDLGKCKFKTAELVSMNLDVLGLTKAISYDDVSLRAQKNQDGFCDLLTLEFVK